MDPESVSSALSTFAANVRADRRANPGIAGNGTALELLLAPRFQALIETLLAGMMSLPPRVLPEYRRAGLGRPDLAFARPARPASAFIELKRPDMSLTPTRLRGHDADQFRRFSNLPLWGFCNFHRITLYRRDNPEEDAVILPAMALEPATADSHATRLVRRHDGTRFLAVLETLALASPRAPRNAAEVAEELAYAARLVRAVVRAQCQAGAPPALALVREEFRDTLFAHPAAGGYSGTEDDLFANAFAQTLAFGLLLAHETVGADIDRDAYRSLSRGIYPLLRATLRALTQDEILDVLGAAFDVLQQTVNAVAPELLTPRAGRDPILYFYEDFLGVFDPEAKKRHGVFFTPVPIVRFMVEQTDRALRSVLRTKGLLDPNVLLLDPACGTGTFLIAAAAKGAEDAKAAYGVAEAELRALASRLHGFELLVGPYTVAHYRLLRELASHGVVPNDRLPVYLADTLAPPAGAAGVTSHLGFMSGPIVDERTAADTLKRETPILAIIGNPPYRRLAEGEEAAIVGGWDNGFWEDLKAPVRAAGWGGELNTFPDLYIAFWRWCLWKLFESDNAPRRGVVCLITNRTFLAGRPYAGLRKMLRERFDTIDIVDLRGDSRGARPAGIDSDENVFAIQAGVCIVVAVATEAARMADHRAEVRYADVWRHGAFDADSKLSLLTRTVDNGAVLDFVANSQAMLADFLPAPFGNLPCPALSDVFAFKSSGIQTKRDALVYAFSEAVLRQRVLELVSSSEEQAARLFQESSDRKVGPARAFGWKEKFARRAGYRPLDIRVLYANQNFISRPRPELQAAWSQQNIGLYALPSGTGAGPAIWVHGLMPDYHAFRGSYGGYAFPLWDRRKGPAVHNLAPGLLDSVGVAIGLRLSPQDVFHAIVALLSAASYTRRFAWDLEEAFARVPFPADPDTFKDAARIGAEIAALETLTREPGPLFRSARLAGRATGVTLAVPSREPFREDGAGSGFVALQEDQALRLAHLPERVWRFAVSGYAVLPRWLAARNGEALDSPLQRAMLDVAWRIEELLYWFDAADPVLERALAKPLTREDLGMPGDATRPCV